MRQIELQEGIASVGLRGFEAKLDMEGIQIELSSSAKKQEFFKLIREYVFDYPTYNQWPPKIETGYELFKYDSKKRQDCCFYWALYGYIENLFRIEAMKETMDLTDLFMLQNMQKYCADPFERYKSDENREREREDKERERRNRDLIEMRKRNLNRDHNREGGCLFGDMYGGENKKDDLPKLGDPEEEEEATKEEIAALKEEIRVRKLPRPVATFAFVCDPSKLWPIKSTLQQSLVTWMVARQKVQTSEWNAMETIVVRYMKDLPDKDLLVEKKELNDIFYDKSPGWGEGVPPISREDLKDSDRPWSKEIIRNEPAIRDPLLGVNYTWGNLLDWFGYPTIIIEKNSNRGKKKKERVKVKDNPNRIARYLLNGFRKKYTLTSAMFELDEKTLTKVRRRFLKLLAAFFSLMKTMYLKIEKQVKGVEVGIERNKAVQGKTQQLLIKINQDIAEATNKNKKARLEKIREELVHQLGPFLRQATPPGTT
jgi:hypothetical protein